MKDRLVIGLMSGTSADGVDAALVRISGSGEQTDARLLRFEFHPYPDDLRAEVLSVSEPGGGTTERLCRLNAVLGERFAAAALAVCAAEGVDVAEVGLIGSHGQTVHHLPEPVTAFGASTRSTLQLGDPGVIVERTGATTVSDFRVRDVAAGGQGAPLVPMVDYLLFRSSDVGRVMLNIGGIANITVLPAGCVPEEVFAFDTGPGNMLVDALVGSLSGGAASFDEGGRMAASGRVCGELLDALMAHPYLSRTPPKSTGREVFGRQTLDQILSWRGRLSDADLLRTVTAFTGASIADAVRRFVLPACEIGQVVASGGGVLNPVLMGELTEALEGVEILRVDDLGLPSEAKEAVAFAVLANETLHGRPGNMVSVTGAHHPVVLGTVAPGRRCRISVD